MVDLSDRRRGIFKLQRAIELFVEDIGVQAAASEVGVSPDTIRRRVRGTQPWFFEEVVDLGRHELERGGLGEIAEAVSCLLALADDQECRPLLLPSNLRALLRLVGRLTTEIADALDDGRVDADEATRLIRLLAQLDQLTAGLRSDLQGLLDLH